LLILFDRYIVYCASNHLYHYSNAFCALVALLTVSYDAIAEIHSTDLVYGLSAICFLEPYTVYMLLDRYGDAPTVRFPDDGH